MKFKVQIFDDVAIYRALTRISYEIVEKSADINNVVLVGIKTRGVPIAEIIRENIFKNTGVSLPVAALDTHPFRDDIKITQKDCELGIDIVGKEVIIVDDVLFTGRTARAAIDALFTIGRAGKIRLAVLVDRGHRELPIRPDYVGKNVPTSMREIVKVNIKEVDGKSNIELFEKAENI